MEIGDIKEIDGVKRIVTGFTMVCGEMQPNTELYTEPEEPEERSTECQYCGKVCKSVSGLMMHEEHCKENPKNKGGEE